MNPTAKRIIAIAALLLCIGTVLGAFAAHGLEDLLDDAALLVFRTGVEYHFYHGLGLLAVGLALDRVPNSRALLVAAYLLIAGIALFSGSLYILAFGVAQFLGPVTPLGGACFIAAWLCLAVGVARSH